MRVSARLVLPAAVTTCLAERLTDHGYSVNAGHVNTCYLLPFSNYLLLEFYSIQLSWFSSSISD